MLKKLSIALSFTALICGAMSLSISACEGEPEDGNQGIGTSPSRPQVDQTPPWAEGIGTSPSEPLPNLDKRPDAGVPPTGK